MEKLRIMSVFGTRPEAIKMAPLVAELQRRPGLEPVCCVTAQHREMLDSVLEIFQLRPDYDLNIMEPRQTLSTITSKRLLGTAPELIRHYIELRGIGVIDVQQLFGMRAVMPESQIDLVVEFEPWDSSKAYDRLGIEDRFIDILGKQVPCVTLPIRPGRNLASIVEVAAMNNRHRRYGYNAAEELARKVDLHADLGSKSASQGK